MVQKIPARNVKAKKVVPKAAKKAKKTTEDLFMDAWQTTYEGHQKDVERANRMLLKAWQKTYDNRHQRLT